MRDVLMLALGAAAALAIVGLVLWLKGQRRRRPLILDDARRRARDRAAEDARRKDEEAARALMEGGSNDLAETLEELGNRGSAGDGDG